MRTLYFCPVVSFYLSIFSLAYIYNLSGRRWMFTRCDRLAIGHVTDPRDESTIAPCKMQLQLHVQPDMRQQFRPGSHGLNMFNFVRSNERLSQRLRKFQPVTNQLMRYKQCRLCGLWTRGLSRLSAQGDGRNVRQ